MLSFLGQAEHEAPEDKSRIPHVALRLMDIERDDLRTVFVILDSDKSGSVTYDEFCDSLHKMKTEEACPLAVRCFGCAKQSHAHMHARSIFNPPRLEADLQLYTPAPLPCNRAM